VLKAETILAPVHGEQEGVRVLCSVTWCAGPHVLSSVAGELFQLLPAARVAEDNLMPGTREQRPELAPHQSRTQNADSHAESPP
jgi:hypothetical protein